jgi:hypothetical protein
MSARMRDTAMARVLVLLGPCRTIVIARAVRIGAGARVAALPRELVAAPRSFLMWAAR